MNDVSPQFVASTRGVNVALHDLGGVGSPLVICHATGFHGRMYEPMVPRLATRFHVYAVDFRGHGASIAPDDGDMAWQGMADDLLACVDVLGKGSVHAFGHSMGGGAILLAELHRPGTIAGAYLYEPIVFSGALLARRGDNPMSGPARRRREVFASRDEALWRFASRPPLNELRADALWLYVQHGFIDMPDGTVRLACRPAIEAATFEAEDKMMLEVVGRLGAVPVVVAAGASSGETVEPSMLARPLVDALVAGQLIEYPFLGHFGPFQDPGRIAHDLVTILG